jgi:large conductance mechanosensitive channel
MYGNFLNAVISFVIVGFVLFMIVKAYNAAKAGFSKPAEEEDDTAEEVVLLREIRDSLQNRNG